MSDYDDWDGELLSSGKGFKRQQRETESSQNEPDSDSDKQLESRPKSAKESLLD